MIKKIINSRILRFTVSVVLIYFAFRQVNVVELFNKITGIKPWFIVLSLLISLISTTLVSFRWSLLLIKNPKFKDVVVFAKSTLSAAFYGLFFPTSVAGDLLKWVIIDEKYPKIPRTKLLGSVILDRIIGLSMFIFVGLMMVFLGGIDSQTIPIWIKLVFVGLFLGCVVFYGILFFANLTKLWNIRFLKKFKNMAELVEKENRKQILKSMGVSLVSQFFWIFQTWFISWYFDTGLSITTIFVFIPIISMILALPISFAGFGAREQLYILFFGGLANSASSVLLTSTFSGVLGIITSLIGGLISLTPDFRRSAKK